jgi:hypothetical protein
MLLGIDHLVIACPDPDAAADELAAAVGLSAGEGGRHEALGTHNRLVWLGDTYLELIGVFDRTLATSSWIGAPTVRALEAGGGLATWAVATDDIDREAERLRSAGSPLGPVVPGERVRPDGRLVRWRLVTPPSLGPAEPPFLIQHDPDGAEWTDVDRAARAAFVHPVGGPVRLDVVELEVGDPGRVAMAFQRTAGLGPFRPSLAGGGRRDAPIGVQTVRLHRATGPAASTAPPIATIHLRVDPMAVAGRTVPAPPVVELLGCRFTLRIG